ncbi:MAG: type 1 glutamine amidotransferase [Actinomycetota bacterium]
MRVLAVGNRGDADPGLVGARLAEVGFALERNEREYPREWKSLAGIDVLLLLGSEWSVYWESNEKEVAAEVDLVQTAIGRGVPIFAICYGTQLVAHALGGTVSRSQHPEVGWHAVSSTAQPELLAHTWLQWHYDVFTVPQSLTAIATNDVGPQAMVGKRRFATQFHP